MTASLCLTRAVHSSCDSGPQRSWTLLGSSVRKNADEMFDPSRLRWVVSRSAASLAGILDLTFASELLRRNLKRGTEFLVNHIPKTPNLLTVKSRLERRCRCGRDGEVIKEEDKRRWYGGSGT